MDPPSRVRAGRHDATLAAPGPHLVRLFGFVILHGSHEDLLDDLEPLGVRLRGQHPRDRVQQDVLLVVVSVYGYLWTDQGSRCTIRPLGGRGGAFRLYLLKNYNLLSNHSNHVSLPMASVRQKSSQDYDVQ